MAAGEVNVQTRHMSHACVQTLSKGKCEILHIVVVVVVLLFLASSMIKCSNTIVIIATKLKQLAQFVCN